MTKDQKLNAYQEQLARVRSTAGYDEEIVEGIASLSDDPNLRNCIVVDGWTSAAFLWEVISQ